jgi:imidazolonepropionase-like amidohydrolase
MDARSERPDSRRSRQQPLCHGGWLATGRLAQGLTAMFAALLAAGAAQAERPRVYAITDARIVTAPGKVIDNGTLVIRDDTIEAVGARVTVPPDAEIIAAEKGWTVYPAFIDAASSVGLEEQDSAPPGRPAGPAEQKKVGAAHELKAVHPEAAVVDQLDTSHSSVARHREMGFAVAQVLPAKGVFRGESAIVMLRSGPARELIARARAAQVIALETQSFMGRQYPSSRMGAVAAVRQTLLDARRDGEWNRRYAANPSGMEPPEFRSSDTPLLAVLRGERPVVFVSIAALDPGRFAGLADEFGLNAMTVARGLGERTEEIGLTGMPLLLPLELPEKPDLADADAVLDTSLEQMEAIVAAPRLPLALWERRKPRSEVGTRVPPTEGDIAFITYGMKNPRKFSENLAAVVKAGLDPARALAAVTTTPAALLGLSRAMGTLEPGKQANLMIVEGELFTEKPVLRHFFVQGYHEEIEAEKTVGDPNAVVDPRGTWQITNEVMGRTSESTWKITGSAGSYAGTTENARSGKRDFASVELKGNALTVISSSPQGEMKLTVVITGETLSGQTTMGAGPGAVTMKVEGRRTAAPESEQ